MALLDDVSDDEALPAEGLVALAAQPLPPAAPPLPPPLPPPSRSSAKEKRSEECVQGGQGQKRPRKDQSAPCDVMPPVMGVDRWEQYLQEDS